MEALGRVGLLGLGTGTAMVVQAAFDFEVGATAFGSVVQITKCCLCQEERC